MAKADFHNHSTASDGKLTPTQLIDLAAARGVKIFAPTDHDSTEGVAEARAAAARHDGFFLIPGVDLSTDIVVDALLLAGEVDSVNGEVFNLGHPRPATLLEFVETLRRFTDFEVEVVPFPEAAAAIDIGDYYGDFSRFAAAVKLPSFAAQ